MDGPSFLSAMVNKTLNKAHSGPWVSEVWDMRGLRVISGPVWGRVLEGHSEVNLRVNLEVNLRYI